MARWDEQERALEQERRQIQQRIDSASGYGLGVAMNTAVGELSGYDQHPADLASEMFEREKDAALRADDLRRLARVDAALQRIADGGYGACQSCGNPIGEDRLEVEPAAGLCMACQRKADAGRMVRRPIEEQVMDGAFSRTNMDGRDFTAFDGEDAWQSVERMNDRPHRAGLDDVTGEDDVTYVEPIEAVSNERYRSQLPD